MYSPIYVIFFCTVFLSLLILWTRPRKGSCDAHRAHLQKEADAERIIEELLLVIARQVAAAAKDRGLEAVISKPDPQRAFGLAAKRITVRVAALNESLFELELLWNPEDYKLLHCRAWFYLRQQGECGSIQGSPFIVFCEKNGAEQILGYLPLLSPTHHC
jgi:hypothetical protein